MLRIADLDFVVTSSQLEAYCNEDSMQWDLEVQCAPNSGGAWYGYQPTLSLSLFETPQRAFPHWTDLAPRETQWEEKHDTDVTPSGLLYVFEHTPVFQCRAQVSNENGELSVTLKGLCDVFYDEAYDTDLKLQLDAPITFRGIWFGRWPESDCREDVSRFLDPDDFEYVCDESGVSILTPSRS